MSNLKIVCIALLISLSTVRISAGENLLSSNIALAHTSSSSKANTNRRTEFLTYNGQRVRLDIYHPGGRGVPAAILIHGAAGIEGDRARRYERFATDLKNRGIAAINVHYFNSPRSHWVRTIEETIEYVSKIQGVDANRVALIGYSLGGTLALSASLASDRVKVLVVNSGALPSDFSQRDIQRLPDYIYMSCGTEDFCYPSLQKLDQMTRGSGKKFTKRVREGEGHTIPLDVFWQQWRDIVDFTVSRLR